MSRVDRPVVAGEVERLAADLSAVGVRDGQDLLVHCSMRRIGPLAGGPATLLAALRRVAGPAATGAAPQPGCSICAMRSTSRQPGWPGIADRKAV